MRVHLAAMLVTLIPASGSAMDIYKCPGGTYANTTETRGPADLEAMGCKRQGLNTDPVSNSGNHEVVIKRSPDGHFWMKGQINGKSVNFIVDTGASFVSVSEEFASAANLKGGRPIVLTTANGKRTARGVEGVSVSASIFTVPKVKIAVGLSGLGPTEGLLGQSFLSQFEVTMDDRQMTLRNKKR